MKKSLFTLTLLPAMLLVACGGTKITAEEFEAKAETLYPALEEKLADATTMSQTATVKASSKVTGTSVLGGEDYNISENGKFTFTMNLETEETTVDPDEDDSQLGLLDFTDSFVFLFAGDISWGYFGEAIITLYSNPLRVVAEAKVNEIADGSTVTVHEKKSLTFGSDGIISKVVYEYSETIKSTYEGKKINASQVTKATVTFSKLVIA